ncbi:MAG: class E sortase, partial [Methanobacterium sp.]
LKPGNKVIIKDKLTQKEYTYEVVSNGNDIRWGVEAEDIKYQTSDNPELWLITCWPPGYSKGDM